MLILWLAAITSCILYSFLTQDQRDVATPVLIMGNAYLAILTIIYRRDGNLPIFDIGFLCVTATALYSIFPLTAYLWNDLSLNSLSDNRLLQHRPTPQEIGAFSWRHVTYLCSLTAAYLFTRGSPPIPGNTLGPLEPSKQKWVLFLLTAISLGLIAIELAYSISFATSYSDIRDGTERSITTLPYFLQQITHNLMGIKILLKQCIILVLIQRWKNSFWRHTLIAWLSVEVVVAALALSARSEIVILLLSTCLLYHRLVRPFKLIPATMIAIVALACFMVHGWLRSQLNEVLVSQHGTGAIMASNNEFQAVFSTSYDLFIRRDKISIPWQVHTYEIFQIIPSQFLPFEKISTSEWYLEVIGMRGKGVGYVFGVISQGVIGLDFIELFMRGIVLGAICGRIHRWYISRANEFRVTLLYLFFCTWSYYTFREGTFSVLYMLVYHFIPFLILIDGLNFEWLRIGRRFEPARLR
jgi:hypothetical protein